MNTLDQMYEIVNTRLT